MKRAIAAVATVLLVVTAGCAATPGAGTPTAADGGDGAAGDGGSGGSDGAGGDGSGDGDADTADSDSGAVNFYVSDEPNDMDDFAHLNVTISTVQFRLVDAAGESAVEENASTATGANGTDVNATGANETTTAAGADESGGEDGRWVTREVNATEVDLSQLRGANATLLRQFDLPAGEYDEVHMEVSAVNGTLTNGESANVKLPSNRLRLNSQFAVENGSEVDFVYDVTVHQAGNSGKYILKPVVSESGTDVPIERVDDEREQGGRGDDHDDERSISASFLANVSAGETVTVRATENGSAVANATVTVDGEAVGATDAGGEYVVSVPSDAEELEVEIESGDAEAELEAEFEASDRKGARDENANGSDGNGGDNGNGDNGGGAASAIGTDDAVATAP